MRTSSAKKYLFERINYERVRPVNMTGKSFKLNRMQKLLELLGNPQQHLPAIHIAGTKGKGSTAVMLAEILTATGIRTGLFTSPHIEHVEERMRVDGEMPQPELFNKLVDQVRTAADLMDRESESLSPTFFELTTAIAWLYFLELDVEVVVLEVGLGGRLDSTNICNPIITMITNISLDHTELLGNNLAEIAAEKGGIIKPGIPLICGVSEDEPRKVIEEICNEHSAPVYQLGHDFTVIKSQGDSPSPDMQTEIQGFSIDVRTWNSQRTDIPVPLAGRHQEMNAALAVAAVELLPLDFPSVTDDSIKAGMNGVKWPLRIESICQQPAVVVDSAHNCASVREFINTVPLRNYRERILVTSISRDKDVEGILKILLPNFDKIIITEFQSNPRTIPVDKLFEIALQLEPITEKLIRMETPEAALQYVGSKLQQSDILCVTGSFFIAAEMRSLLLSPASPIEINAPKSASRI